MSCLACSSEDDCGGGMCTEELDPACDFNGYCQKGDLLNECGDCKSASDCGEGGSCTADLDIHCGP